MKVGIMQPYFFPYIGYWQLIGAVDIFVLFDDVQYIRHGWVNRNRVLKEGGGWKYISVPLKKHSRETKIKDIEIQDDLILNDFVMRNLAFYIKNKKRLPYFDETFNFLNNLLGSIKSNKLSTINEIIIKEISKYLGISTKIFASSTKGFNYDNVKQSGDWALEISKQLGATEYINPIGGIELFDNEKFKVSGISLNFLKPRDLKYRQLDYNFEPWLSIIDVLFFNGKENTINMLKCYEVLQWARVNK